MEAYFDNSATTKVYPEVKDMMIKVMDVDYGNPSSLHMKGVSAEGYIKNATNITASTLKVEKDEIFFTSGGTESNNLAIIGIAMAHQRLGKHIISSSIEHASVLSPLEFLKKQGFEITYIGTDQNGVVDPLEFAEAVREDTILVTCMMVNNEIGSIQPVKEINRLIKKKNPKVIFHVDAIQAFGKIPVFPKKIGCDLLSVSGHKIHGPKGSGILYIKKNTLIKPIIYGGGQQRKLRSGTENVPAIAGFGEAVRVTFTDFDKKIEHIRGLKSHLIDRLTKIENVYSNSGEAPHIASISFVGVRSEVMLHALEEKEIYVSSGSACSSNKKTVSSVLTAISLPKERLESTLRFSFSEDNTMEQVDYACDVIEGMIGDLRKFYRK